MARRKRIPSSAISTPSCSDSAVAGSFLLLASAADADIWLNRSSDVVAPQNLHADALIAAGWRQVASQYDAGVTRQHRH